MGFGPLTLRRLLKGGNVLLLLALWVCPSEAAQAPRHGTRQALRQTLRQTLRHTTPPVRVAICDPDRPEPSALKAFVRQPLAVGGPVAKQPRRSRIDRVRVLTIGRRPLASPGDDLAIQNDAPAAHVGAHPTFTLRPLGLFVDAPEQHPVTIAFSPRSQRGPPPIHA
jgi:hypothetical protein